MRRQVPSVPVAANITEDPIHKTVNTVVTSFLCGGPSAEVAAAAGAAAEASPPEGVSPSPSL